MKKKIALTFLTLTALLLFFTACYANTDPDVATVPFNPKNPDGGEYSTEIADAAEIILRHTSPETVTASGAYRYGGTLSDGGITVNVDKTSDDGTVYLILSGVDITSTSTPIRIIDAQKTVIILESGTHNKITQNVENADNDTDLPSAAIYSKSDLIITGDGALDVTTNYNDGITSKGSLIIADGTIAIDAAYDGVVGKDAVTVKGGNITINAGKDGIRSTNEKDAEKGYVAIYDGTFVINSGDDCIQAVSSLQIHGGNFELTAGSGNDKAALDDAPNNPEQFAENRPEMPQNDDFTPPQKPDGDNPTPPEMPRRDDDMRRDMPQNGNFGDNRRGFDDFERQHSDVPSPKGLVCDGDVLISGGVITIHNSYEGIEGADVTIDGGDITVNSDDDGVNVDVYGGEFVMNGGRLVITAGGDGVDSNGTITLNGGEIIVDTDAVGAMDTPIDHETGFTQNGGTATDTEGNAIEVSSMVMGGGRPGGIPDDKSMPRRP